MKRGAPQTRDVCAGLAARALSRGDPLAALSVTAVASTGDSLALRGIAFAQLGDYRSAEQALEKALEVLGSAPRHASSCARTLAALAEVRIAARRDLAGALNLLEKASRLLVGLGDRRNAAWLAVVRTDLLLLLGRMAAAEKALSQVEDLASGDPFIKVGVLLSRSRQLISSHRPNEAARKLKMAQASAERLGHPLLLREAARIHQALHTPCARLHEGGHQFLVSAVELEERMHARATHRRVHRLIIDARTQQLDCGGRTVDLRRRGVLFTLLLQLAKGPIRNAELFEATFGLAYRAELHSARLRVELGRLRQILSGIANVEKQGEEWKLIVPRGVTLGLITPLNPSAEGNIRALLSDGQSWSVRSLTFALGWTPRTTQRALATQVQQGVVMPIGRGRTRRYLLRAATSGFASQMLLLAGMRERYTTPGFETEPP